MRAYRDQFLVNIRKEQITKKLKRNRENYLKSMDGEYSNFNVPASFESSQALYDEFVNRRALISKAMEQEDIEALTKMIIEVRQIVSQDTDNIPFKEFMRAKMDDIFVNFLDQRYKTCALIQKNCCWTLMNITKGDGEVINKLLSLGLIDKLTHFFEDCEADILELAIGIVSNIIGDDLKFRDMVFKTKTFDKMVFLPQERFCENYDCAIAMAWVISGCLRGRPFPNLDQATVLIQKLLEILNNYETQELSVEASWAVSYFTEANDHKETRITNIITSDFNKFIVNWVQSDVPKIYKPALRALGNISSMSNEIVELFFNSQIVQHLVRKLKCPYKGIKRDAVWTISNLAASTDKMRMLVTHKPILDEMISQLSSASIDVQLECMFYFKNLFFCGTHKLIIDLRNSFAQFVDAFLSILGQDNYKLQLSCLEVIWYLLQSTSNDESVHEDLIMLFTDSPMIDNLLELQKSPSTEVYQSAIKTVDEFFDTVDEHIVIE